MPKTPARSFPVVLYVLIWLCFIILFVIAKNPPSQFDIQISNSFHDLAMPGLNQLMTGASFLGETLPSIILAAAITIWFWMKGYKREAIWFVISLIAVSSTTSLIKNIVDRTRPNGDAFSFISGHTSYFTVFGGYSAFNIQKLIDDKRWVRIWRIALIVIVGIIALSRIYLGAHWPTDVLGGFLWGFIVLLPVQWGLDNTSRVGT